MQGAAVVRPPFTVAGIPGASWLFALRIWLATVLALYVSFWLELDAPSSAAITVAILALPTRGQGMDKALFRVVATVLGVVASLAIIGVFAQSDVIMLWVFAAWIGLCVFTVGLLDGNRAYAASLGVTTVAIVAIEQIDAPQQVFEAGIARGSAIVVGVLAITLVNDILGAPDHYLRISSQLIALRQGVREYSRNVLRGQKIPAATVAQLLRQITALRPDINGLASESSSGGARAASARAAMVDLVVSVSATRALEALPIPSAVPAGYAGPAARASAGHSSIPAGDLLTLAREHFADDVERSNAECGENLSRLHAGRFPEQSWRTPLYRSPRIALEHGIKAALYFVLASTLFGMASWPSVSAAVAFVALLIALGATTPDPGAFTKLAVMISPFACVFAGILQFIVLDGATGFPMLAIALAPFVIICALLMTSAHTILSSVGRLNLVFILALLAPSNPQNYNPETFLVSCLFVCLAAGVLFALQIVLPPMSPQRQVRQLLLEARHDIASPRLTGRSGPAPEEAAFRCALRVGQVAGLAPDDRDVLDEAMRTFDQATSLRRCGDELDRLDDAALADAVAAAREALGQRDAGLLMETAERLRTRTVAYGGPVTAACTALVAAACMLSARPSTAEDDA